MIAIAIWNAERKCCAHPFSMLELNFGSLIKQEGVERKCCAHPFSMLELNFGSLIKQDIAVPQENNSAAMIR